MPMSGVRFDPRKHDRQNLCSSQRAQPPNDAEGGGAMKVKVYDVDTEPYKETLRSTCTLDECFPERDAAYYVALVELNRMGRCWCGGGAAPCTLLMKVED
jgi:hypothetical protein